MSLVVEALSDVAAFERAQKQWDGLIERTGRHEVFLSHRWLAAWFRHFLGEHTLLVLVVKEGERWVGALPLVMRTVAWRGLPIRFLGLPVNMASGNLRSDLVVGEAAIEVARALVVHLESHCGQWECLELDGFSAGTLGFAALQEAIQASSLRTTTWQVDQELYFLHPTGTWEDYLGTRGRKFRRNLHAASNRLARAAAMRLQTCRAPDALAVGLQAVFDLDSRSTKAGREGVHLLEGAAAGFYRSLVAEFGATGECGIDLICDGNIPVASLLTLYSRGTAFLLHVANAPNAATVSPGRMLFAHLIARAWQDGTCEVDLNGRTRFVQTWSDTARAVLRCTVYSRSVRSRLAFWRDEVLAPARIRASRGHALCPSTPIPRVAQGVTKMVGDALPRALRERPAQYYQDGRTALALGLDALALASGDEVLFPAYHCGSEFEVLRARGYKLRYYPVPLRLEVDVATLERVLTPRTRAVYLIHYLGLPQDVAPIAAFCRARRLLLIEDCAQALYSGSNARSVGLHGDLAIFSLHKFLPLTDGGAAVIGGRRELPPGDGLGARDHLLLALRCAAFASRCAAGRAAALVHIGIAIADAGWHFARIAPIARARAMSDASRRRYLAIDHGTVVARRLQNYRQLHALFSGLAGVEPLLDPGAEGFVPLLFPLWVDNPAPLLASLDRAGIEVGLHWSAIDARFPIEQFPEVVRLKAHLLVMPVHQDMSSDDQARIAHAVASMAYISRPDTALESNSARRNTVQEAITKED